MPLPELARALVRFYHVASVIVNWNHALHILQKQRLTYIGAASQC